MKTKKSGPTVTEADRAIRGQIRVRLNAEASELVTLVRRSGESLSAAASRLIIDRTSRCKSQPE